MVSEKQIINQESVEGIYSGLLLKEPKPVANFVPSNADEQKSLFLSGEVENPQHDYSKLDDIDFAGNQQAIADMGARLAGHPDMNPKFLSVYGQFINNYASKTELMRLAHGYNHVDDEDEKSKIAAEYMKLNIEQYGEPDEVTYRSLLSDKLTKINSKNLSDSAAKIKDELMQLVDYQLGVEAPDRFRPSPETVEWTKGVVESLYGGMLSHIPDDKESFSVVEAQQIFTEIIAQEFGEAAEGWRVDVEAAKSINVKSAEKRIVIPEDRGSLSRDALRRLVVHEIGVHMMRAVIGGETDLQPLANGLNDYYDAEEGLGVVMEQALDGRVTERGVDHYITTGLAYHDSKDFREIFEVKWRLALLEGAREDVDIQQADINSARNRAYGQTMRIMRGTDELPWFKDLAYYNGSAGVWKYLEEIRGDDLQLSLLLAGKVGLSKDHQRTVLESRSVD